MFLLDMVLIKEGTNVLIPLKKGKNHVSIDEPFVEENKHFSLTLIFRGE